MLSSLLTPDDPMEQLIYGEPDPWLRLFECRHILYTNFDAHKPANTWGSHKAHSHTEDGNQEQERSRGAVVGRQIGPVVVPAPEQDTNTDTETPPDAVLCLYQWQGEVRSMALPECTTEALQANWTPLD